MANAKLMKAHEKYSDLDNITVSAGREVTTWRDGDEKRVRIYDVKQFDEVECCKYGEYMMECLDSGSSVDAELLNIMLRLAVSMRNPEDTNKFLLLAPVRERETLMVLSTKGLVEIQDQDTHDAEILARLRAGTSTELELNADEAAAEGGTTENELNNITKASVYSFLAGFLLRVQCRNVQYGNLKAAANRYKGWYDHGYEMFDTFNITRSSIEQLKMVVSRKPEVVGTWVMWLANTENESRSLTKQPRELLEYIGIQIYSYQGLHVVTQILAIEQLTKVPMSYILKELECPITREGVLEVDNIIKNYEVSDAHPERKTYFRYARVWGDGYFLRVQSKNCVPLLYTAARVVKEISSSGASDPTQIYAVKNIGDALRSKLDKAAGRLVRLLLSHTTVG